MPCELIFDCAQTPHVGERPPGGGEVALDRLAIQPEARRERLALERAVLDGARERLALGPLTGRLRLRHNPFNSSRSSCVPVTTTSAAAISSAGASGESMATRTPSSSSATAANASRSVVSSPA